MPILFAVSVLSSRRFLSAKRNRFYFLSIISALDYNNVTSALH